MNNIDPIKIKKDINDLRDKKQTLLLSLQNDIDDINNDIMKEFCKIGQQAYEMSVKGEAHFSALSEGFANIERHKAGLEKKNKKIDEITERYDDEITILEKLVLKETEVAAGTQAFCSNCGRPYMPQEDIFCMGCGSEL